MPNTGRLPDFILVGAQKCGTTTLSDMLDAHHAIGMSEIKEPNYFGSSGRVWARDEAGYRALFADLGDAQVVGEATATYLYDPRALDRIRAELPETTRILVILREPARRAFSHWGHLRYHMLFEDLDFEEALAREGEREIAPHQRPGTFRYVWGSLYADKLRGCFERFGRERVLVLTLEELVADPQGVFSGVCRFLGVDDSVAVELPRSNPASESSAPAVTAAMVRRPRFVDALYHRLPGPLKRFVFRAASRVFEGLRKPREDAPRRLPPELHARLAERFAPDVRALEELLGRELPAWHREARQPTAAADSPGGSPRRSTR